ncbi:MAG: hypothetical protein KJ025_02570 [Burkholderiales bacterium]|nr:hypothetical protein [Burkholderiales bacterium]
MRRRTARAVALALAAIVSVLTLAGCGSLPQLNGVEIVEWQHQERQRLEAQGFVQYNWD